MIISLHEIFTKLNFITNLMRLFSVCSPLKYIFRYYFQYNSFVFRIGKRITFLLAHFIRQLNIITGEYNNNKILLRLVHSIDYICMFKFNVRGSICLGQIHSIQENIHLLPQFSVVTLLYTTLRKELKYPIIITYCRFPVRLYNSQNVCTQFIC